MNRMTRIKAMIIAAATAAASMSVCIPAAQADDYVLEVPAEIVSMFGDVNADSTIAVSDAVQLMRYLLGQDEGLGNWRNADLISDENIDVFDFLKLRKVLAGEEEPEGSKLTVKVVDMMTGEPIEGVDIMLHSECEFDGSEYSFRLGEFISGDDDINLFGLPADAAYNYIIEVLDLPGEYLTFGGWEQSEFSFDDNSEEKEIVIRLLSKDTDCDLVVDLFNWSSGISEPGSGYLEITDKDGNLYYPNVSSYMFALPDGDYHADLKLYNLPIAFLDPDGEFADELREIFPDAELKDGKNGFDFTVKDGRIIDDIRFDIGPIEDMSNEVRISCIDLSTGEPIEGVQMSLIEKPDEFARVVKTWTSSADGPETVTDLKFVGWHSYKVKVDSVPEGYDGIGEDYLVFGFVNNESRDVTFYFTKQSDENDLVANIYNWSDDCALFNDLCTVDIWIEHSPEDCEIVVRDITPGEAFSLPDGEYVAALDFTAVLAKGYRGVNLLTASGNEFKASKPFSGYKAVTTDMLTFTVKDGKADKAIDLYVQNYAPYEKVPTEALTELFEGLSLGEIALLDGLDDLF